MDITNELLAAYATGNVSESERKAVRQYLANHPEQLETILIMMDDDFDIQLEDNNDGVSPLSVNQELDSLLDEIELDETVTGTPSTNILPLLSRAAKNVVDNLCAIRCEGYALRHLGIDVADKVLEQEARQKGWLREDGMPLHLIGWSSGVYGSSVTRRYNCSVSDISKALKKENVVIVVIDNSELTLSPREARKEDIEHGKLPNHAVVITSLDLKQQTIDIFNPGFPDLSKTYPLDIFVEAWNDSYNYLVTISNYNKYDPSPLDLSDVELEDELIELREAIAENAHEVWAQARKIEGWTYGPKRDDEKKLHPDMQPYHSLPESEKEYDRQLAINTIKLVKKLGWELKKRK